LRDPLFIFIFVRGKPLFGDEGWKKKDVLLLVCSLARSLAWYSASIEV